jgi:hypothetical protein
VCLSLSTGQQVRHAERDRSLSKSILAGDVIVLRPGIPTETTLEGDAEVVQIFIDPESLGQVASTPVTGTLVAPPTDALKRAVVRLFVCARHDDRRGRRAAEILLRKEVRALLAAPVGDEREPEGVPRAVISRAETPGTANVDLGVVKTIELGGHRHLDLIAQFFNLFNHVSATAINPFFGTGAVALPGFGQPIQGVIPRQIQFGANFEY